MALFDSLNQMKEARQKTTRRRFLFGGIAAVIGYFGFRQWRYRARAIANRVTKFISPNSEFYSVAIDEGFRPNVMPEDWRLEIVGLQGNAISLGYDELQKLENRRVYKTFMCVGNEAGGPFLNNAEWTVTPLAPLLQKVLGTALPENLRVMFHALDGFYSSVALADVMHERAFIAYEMNGEKLPNAHGFPARVFLPGLYGMKQPRWLSKIEILPTPWVKGYYEVRGYSDSAKIKMTARIDYAMRQKEGDWLITGVALCGLQSVGKVEISFDNGNNWIDAKITSEKLPDAWATWEARWTPARKGDYVLAARVTDASGNQQITFNNSSFPSGTSGLHRVVVSV